ncbi:hypothetical protein BJV82DRAFT_518563 [Fennellomyces sp. T-0311]|nr:hypothetical protein BJV82DRAFT_518563 [Fennellomyces sp. T-0311]
MNPPSQIVSQQVFGSSKKLQFVNSSPTKQQSMSIESLLASNGDSPTNDMSISALTTSSKRRWHGSEDEEPQAKMRKQDDAVYHPAYQPMTTIKCLHAAVAQKSYGSEKRFLCPPPIVSLRSSNRNFDRHSQEISMAIVCENGERPLEHRVILDETLSGSFKFLHVTGTAKAKQFCLRVSLNMTQQEQPYATFLSHPISIISKPSKKTAKARNVSSCILANAPISLFNRINSQTVRTKYLTSADRRLCAKNASWSPFDIVLVRPPMHASGSLPVNNAAMPVTYGTELMLRDHNTGVTSPLLIIRKVDKGRIAQCAFGPVSQMQKVALQLASTNGTGKPMYLSAAGATMDGVCTDAENGGHTSSSWIDFAVSRIVQPDKPSLELPYEEVDDYLCWTIVGIAQFEYSFFEPEIPSSPPQPKPQPRRLLYKPTTHSLDIFGEHLIQAAPDPRILECWLGSHGPLSSRHVTAELLAASNPSVVVTPQPGNIRRLEFPLLFARQDGVVYHSGKAIEFNIWSVVREDNADTSEFAQSVKVVDCRA